VKGELVLQLAREPGKRDCRYIHQFADFEQVSASPSSIIDSASQTQSQESERIAQLETRVDQLTQQVATLTQLVKQFTD